MNLFYKKPFLIGEIGANFYDIAVKENISNMEAAKLMIREAKDCGIDAVKFQSYKAESLTLKDSPTYWDLSEESATSQFELFKKFDDFGKEEYSQLSKYCDEIGIMFMSTPFDFESADYLDDLMSVYKVSSSDLTNIPFIQYIAAKNKPILLSTGASTLNEIKQAILAIEEVSNVRIAVLHSVLSYPTNYEDANLLMIKDLTENFSDYDIGYSDHTKPDENMLVLTTAFNYGANIIEKHFTLDKTLKGNDHYHSMDPNDVKIFRKSIAFSSKINGKKNKQPLICESSARREARRSIVTSDDIEKDEIITREMLTFKRPGTGISPSRIDDILGKKAVCSIKKDTLIDYDMVG